MSDKGEKYIPADAHWLKFNVPKFKVGQKVWVIDRLRGGCDETEIRNYNLEGHEFDGKFVIVMRGYLMQNAGLNMRREYHDFVPTPEDEIFDSKAKAVLSSDFRKVKFSAATWKKAIGLGPKTDRAKYDEECELGPCCAVISEIRDCLAKCMKDGGMIQLDIWRLQSLLDSHDHGAGRMEGALGRILNAIGCKIKKESV